MPKVVAPFPFRNIGFLGFFVAVFVGSFFAAHLASDLTVLLLYGPHAFFSEGLRVASWKHATLSNGVVLPWYGNLLLGPPTVLFTVLLVFAAEFVLGRTRAFLAATLPWATPLVRALGGAVLLAFAYWLYRVAQFHPLHPVPLSSLIGGLVLLWKSLARRRLSTEL